MRNPSTCTIKKIRKSKRPIAYKIHRHIATRHITHRRAKDFGDKIDELHDIVSHDSYHKYRDNSQTFSDEDSPSSEIDDDEAFSDTTEFDHESRSSAVVMYSECDTESLTSQISAGCCPGLPIRRRSIDKATNDRTIRDKYKRRSQENRQNVFLSKRVVEKVRQSKRPIISPSHLEHRNHPTTSNNASVNTDDNDFEKLIQTKISEIQFEYDTHDGDTWERKFNVVNDSNHTINADQFFIGSKLPKVERPSEIPNQMLKNIIPKLSSNSCDKNPISNNATKSLIENNPFINTFIYCLLLLFIVIMLAYFMLRM